MRKLILLVLLIAPGCSTEEPPESTAAAPVSTSEAERGSIRQIVTADGILYPINQATIIPKISAPIRVLYVNRGDRVRQGQLIAELENRDLVAGAAEAKAVYDQAEAAFESTTAVALPEDLNRAQRETEAAKQAMDAAQKILAARQELFRQGALSQRLVDEANGNYVQAKSQYEIAQKHLDSLQGNGRQATIRNYEAQVQAAKARYEAAEVQLSYTRIISPISGVVSERPQFVGQTASPDIPLATVIDTSRIVVRTRVPSAQLQLIKVGETATISLPDDPMDVSGKVTVVSPALDPNSTTAEVWIEAANPENRLHPGASSKVNIVTAVMTDAVTVPATALLSSAESKTVVLVVDSDSVVREREVSVGVREGEKVQITDGIEPGERVVTAGGLGLEDGTKVEVQ